MNQTKLPDPRLDTPPPAETPEQRGTLGGRILGYSFLASVVINLGWLGWVSSSDLFGGKAPLDLHPQVIKMVKIAQKPKPKPPEKKPPPPPPPPKQPPPKPLKTPPKVQPKLIRPKAAAPRPSPTRAVPTARSNRSVSNVPAMPYAPPADTGPVNPGVESHQPPTPPAPPQPDPVPVAPVAQAPKPEPKPTPPPPPPPKVDPPKPKGWVPIESREAMNVPSVDVSADGIDAGSINNNEIVISYTIDETGRVKGARIKKSCGSSELDNRVLDAVRRQRCAPAIQDHIPRESREEFHFPVTS